MSQRALSVESFKVMDVLQRANELQAAGCDVIHCEVGQPETGAPVVVADAAIAALSPHSGPEGGQGQQQQQQRRQVLGYTDSFGLLSLRQKIAQHYTTKYQLSEPISTSRIAVTTGSSGGFLLAFTGCFDAGDVVAIASSGYPCYRNILSALGCTLANVPIHPVNFKLTAKELQAEIHRRQEAGLVPLKGLILSSPSNPTGAMLDPDELKDLCSLCDEEGIQFLSDEIYHGISYGKKEATALMYSDKAIVLNSFSKYYSMSGWRLGWMIIPESLIPPMNALQQNMFINAPTISQTAALHCWEDATIAELEQHVTKYKSNRKIVLEQLALLDPGFSSLTIAPADGGFYIYIDLGDANVAPGYGSVEMCRALLEEEYVAFTPGNDFEDPTTNLGDRRFRISYAGGLDRIQLGMERFRRFWPTWLERVQQAEGAFKG